MRTSELVFIGIRGTVIALDRSTGQQVWSTRLRGMDFVNVVLDGGAVLAMCAGEIFCLEALSGQLLWHNPLKGLGRGLATIVTEGNPADSNSAIVAQRQRHEEAASAAAVSVV